MIDNQAKKPVVENISCILAENQQEGGLFLGNVFGAQNAGILKEYGIRAMITASAETKVNHSIEDIPFHLRIDAHDRDEYYIVEHVNDCIHFIETNRKFTNVFVHCYAGVSRSSAIVAAYLMWKYRWTLDKTLAFLVYKRIVAKPNNGFIEQLRQIEVKLNIVPDRQKELKPASPPLTEAVGIKRPLSIGQQVAVQKPQSPALQHQGNVGQQNGTMKGDPYMVQLEQSNYGRNGGQTVNAKYDEKQYANHSHIPIPKVLARRQVEPAQPSNNQYPNQQIQEKGRKSIYNDYMSPEVMPTSPRQGQFQKGSLGKTGWGNSRSGVNYSSSKDNTMENSLYTTGKGVKKGMMESQEKAKSGSRCIIRPKDLPGYKNY